MGSFLAVFIGLALFAALHSLLLTEAARGLIRALVGEAAFRGCFRFGFCLLAIVLFVLYLHWVFTLSDAHWFALSGPVAWLLRAVQLSAIWLLWKAGTQFGVASFLGWDELRRWRRGEPPAPTRGDDGLDLGPIVASGPYRYVRHPMYSAGLLLVWATPVWSANRFSFALAVTLYLLVGARLEEARLSRLHGESYRRYAAETPRLVPRLWESPPRRDA